MPAEKIQANFDDLAHFSSLFSREADQLNNLFGQVRQCIDQLQSGDWSGQGAQNFFTEMEALVLPGMDRLVNALGDASQATQQIVQTLQQAEQEAARQFEGDGAVAPSGSGAGGGLAETLGSLLGRPDKKLAPGQGVSIGNYQNGVNGWSLIGGANRPFVAQPGANCWLYAPMNAAIAAGYDISQTRADGIANSYSTWNPFWEGQQNSILDDLGATYTRRDFDEWGHGPLGTPGFNRAAAERWLIDNVQAGRPVMVNTATDNAFGIAGARHAYTVVGVRTDASGNLTSVLVNTNWGSAPYYEIPANSFLTDWGRGSGDGIAVNPRPTGR